jgi:hypothetical protein
MVLLEVYVSLVLRTLNVALTSSSAAAQLRKRVSWLLQLRTRVLRVLHLSGTAAWLHCTYVAQFVCKVVISETRSS